MRHPDQGGLKWSTRNAVTHSYKIQGLSSWGGADCVKYGNKDEEHGQDGEIMLIKLTKKFDHDDDETRRDGVL